MTELYGDWPKIKARVDGGAKGAPLLRELFAELQRRKAGFEGTAGEWFREMTGTDEKLAGPLYESFWGLLLKLVRNGELVSVDQRSGASVYRVSAEGNPPPEPTGTRPERPQTWRDNAMDVTELYGDWPKIKARVDGRAKRAPLLRELYTELLRRKAGFEGTFDEVFREMTGYPASEKLTGTGLGLNNSFWGILGHQECTAAGRQVDDRGQAVGRLRLPGSRRQAPASATTSTATDMARQRDGSDSRADADTVRALGREVGKSCLACPQGQGNQAVERRRF